MRHRVYGKHLGRDKNARNALFKNLVRSLVLWEKIETTQAKAKAVKGLVDKLINAAKTPNTRRLVSQFLIDKKAQEKLIKELAPKLSGRTSGYTSITRLGQRMGDGAMMVEMRLLISEDEKGEKEKSKKQLPGLSSQLPDKSSPVISKSVTEKQKTGNRKKKA